MADPTLKIEGARFILTVDPQRRIIQNGSILIEGQKNRASGKSIRAGQRDRRAGH